LIGEIRTTRVKKHAASGAFVAAVGSNPIAIDAGPG
jgi:hypothetical protein